MKVHERESEVCARVHEDSLSPKTIENEECIMYSTYGAEPQHSTAKPSKKKNTEHTHNKADREKIVHKWDSTATGRGIRLSLVVTFKP